MQKLLGLYRRQLSTVAVKLCTGQSALKKLNCCNSREGARAQCPIAGDANHLYDTKTSEKRLKNVLFERAYS